LADRLHWKLCGRLYALAGFALLAALISAIRVRETPATQRIGREAGAVGG
jgi:hypothetical protein